MRTAGPTTEVVVREGAHMLNWVAAAVSSVAQWASWIGKDNGPAVGRKSRGAWRVLALLGSTQLWVAVILFGGLVLWWTYRTAP
jgi:hypothetical protein